MKTTLSLITLAVLFTSSLSSAFWPFQSRKERALAYYNKGLIENECSYQLSFRIDGASPKASCREITERFNRLNLDYVQLDAHLCIPPHHGGSVTLIHPPLKGQGQFARCNVVRKACFALGDGLNRDFSGGFTCRNLSHSSGDQGPGPLGDRRSNDNWCRDSKSYMSNGKVYGEDNGYDSERDANGRKCP